VESQVDGSIVNVAIATFTERESTASVQIGFMVFSYIYMLLM
jgi:hypothetical protein